MPRKEVKIRTKFFCPILFYTYRLKCVADSMYITVQVNGTSGKDPVAFAKSWLSAHEKSSQQLGKPFVVEEFGKNVYDRSAANIAKTRDPVFAAVYDALADSLKSNGVFRGTNVSCWYMNACCKLHIIVVHRAP